MATISELNVRLGLQFKNFENGLKTVERRLEKSGRKFSQLGNDLALFISAPLAALGGAAIKQAGEIESLKLAMVSTFETAGRSAEEATKELDALRKSALAPGLDFEQAVKGSIRLQGVGYSAEAARKTLEEMANAIALTGGTAQNLDSVTVQFAQMIAKGKVLSQDLRVIQEAMPKVSGLMKQAFGTQNAEALQKMGISGKEFVDKITAAAIALPRVEGGIKNALVNAGAAARQSLASLGETIVKTFDVKGLLDSFSKGLQGAVEWFQGLNVYVQKAIVYFGLFVASIGPVVKAIGLITNTGASLVSLFGLIVGGVKKTTGAVLYAIEAIKKISLVTQGFVAIGLAAAVFAAVYAFNSLNKEISTAEKIQKNVNAVNLKAAESIAKEKVAADLLIGTLNKETASRQEKKKALDELKKISPEYFGKLKEENGLVVGLKKAYDDYIVSLLKSAKAAAARERIVELEKKGLDLTEQQTKAQDAFNKEKERLDQRLVSINKNTRASIDAERDIITTQGLANAKGNLDAINAKIKALEDQKKAIAEVAAANTSLAESNTYVSGTTGTAAAEDDNRAKVLARVLNSIDAVNKKQAELGSDFVGEKTREIEQGVEKLIESGFAPNSAPVQKLKGYLKDIRAEISKGFGAANPTQAATGISPAAPAPLPTIPTPGSVAQTGVTGAQAAIEQAKALGQSFKDAAAAYEDFTGRMESKMSVFDTIQKSFADAKNGAISFGDAVRQSAQALGEEWQTKFSGIYDAASQLFSNIADLQKQKADEEKAAVEAQYAAKLEAASGNASARAAIEEDLANKLRDIDRKRGRAAQIFAITSAIIDTALGVTKALGSAPPPYNFIQAALTAAAGAVQIATIKSQKFADGGVIKKPTFGLVGEYPGASRNPEIITPERLMRSVFRSEIANGTGGRVEVFGTIRGSDIYISNQKAERERGRVR